MKTELESQVAAATQHLPEEAVELLGGARIELPSINTTGAWGPGFSFLA